MDWAKPIKSIHTEPNLVINTSGNTYIDTSMTDDNTNTPDNTPPLIFTAKNSTTDTANDIDNATLTNVAITNVAVLLVANVDVPLLMYHC